MNIWILQIIETLPLQEGVRKMRTALLADELVRRGHKVDWFASAFHHQDKKFLDLAPGTHVTENGIRIHLLKGLGYKKNLSLMRILDHRKVAREFSKVSRAMSPPDLIVVSSPDHHLAYAGARYAVAHGVPYIVDVRDQWPEIFLEHLPRVLKPLARLALAQDFYRFRYVTKNAVGITSMMGELLKWAVGYSGRKTSFRDQVFYLGCPPHASSPLQKWQHLKDQITGKKVVTFIGTFGSYYHPKVLAEIARELTDQPLHFILGGHGVYYDEVAGVANGLKNVTLTGWLKDSDMNEILEISDLCVICANRPVQAFPNKAFVYFSAGLPVINSCSGELADLIAESGAGINYPAGDREALKSAILSLMRDSEKMNKMSEAAAQIFRDRLDADKIYVDFANYLESVVGSSGVR